MDDIQNFRAFLKAAERQSFSAAARDLGVAPSVATKRVSQLEHLLRQRLFERTTRSVTLTAFGERALPVVKELVGEFEQVMTRLRDSSPSLEGHLRIKCPTTLAHRVLGKLFVEFQMLHTGLSMDVFLIDRAIDPVEEGMDVAFGGASSSYGNTIDIPIMPLNYIICAAPSCIERHGRPTHPRQLATLPCLNFFPMGTTWSFSTPEGEISVNTSPVISSNDLAMILEATRNGNGIARLPSYVAAEALENGDVVEVLPNLSVQDLWLKALVPENRIHFPPCEALVNYVKEQLSTGIGLGG